MVRAVPAAPRDRDAPRAWFSRAVRGPKFRDRVRLRRAARNGDRRLLALLTLDTIVMARRHGRPPRRGSMGAPVAPARRHGGGHRPSPRLRRRSPATRTRLAVALTVPGSRPDGRPSPRTMLAASASRSGSTGPGPIRRRAVPDRHGRGAGHGLHDPSTDVTGDDPVATGKIALAHLNEFPDYYTRLEQMEEQAKREHGMG